MTVDLLRAEGDLVTDLVPIEDAPTLFADLSSWRHHTMQAVLTFDAA